MLLLSEHLVETDPLSRPTFIQRVWLRIAILRWGRIRVRWFITYGRPSGTWPRYIAGVWLRSLSLRTASQLVNGWITITDTYRPTALPTLQLTNLLAHSTKQWSNAVEVRIFVLTNPNAAPQLLDFRKASSLFTGRATCSVFERFRFVAR